MTRVAVVGSTGFVGEAVVRALQARGIEVVRVKAPRLGPPTEAHDPAHAAQMVKLRQKDIDHLAEKLGTTAAVVNCAGNPDASSRDEDALNRANAECPTVVGAACTKADVPRLVHVSTAAVQGRRPVLDDTLNYDPFSPYARSKILGEGLLLAIRPFGTVIYRPPSVHAADRRVTRITSRIAGSRFASVAAPGDSPTPQALLENVADAIAFLATCKQKPPAIVCHPWEGLTTASLLHALGNRNPIILPRILAKTALQFASLLSRFLPSVAANLRRVEMIWFGQRQEQSWLTRVGWTPTIRWTQKPAHSC